MIFIIALGFAGFIGFTIWWVGNLLVTWYEVGRSIAEE